jgi:hypothetical protein
VRAPSKREWMVRRSDAIATFSLRSSARAPAFVCAFSIAFSRGATTNANRIQACPRTVSDLGTSPGPVHGGRRGQPKGPSVPLCLPTLMSRRGSNLAAAALLLFLLAAPAATALSLPSFLRRPSSSGRPEDALIAWVRGHGGNVTVRVGPVPGRGGLRGMMATAPVKAGGALVVLPSKLSVPMGTAEYTTPVSQLLFSLVFWRAWSRRKKAGERVVCVFSCACRLIGPWQTWDLKCTPTVQRPVSCAHPSHSTVLTSHTKFRALVSQENVLLLLQRRFADPEWHAGHTLYWASLPRPGKVWTKETFRPEDLANLQDEDLVRGLDGCVNGFHWGRARAARAKNARETGPANPLRLGRRWKTRRTTFGLIAAALAPLHANDNAP